MFSVLGAGSPLVDYNAAVDEDFLTVNLDGGKGGTVHLDSAGRERLLRKLPHPPLRTPGGSAANTITALAKLGVPCGFCGVLGADDDGDFFTSALREAAVTDELIRRPGETGCCISLVTPDAERTMRSFLGVSLELTSDFFTGEMLHKYTVMHIEGYMFQLPDFEKIICRAKAAGCRISLDLSSYELAAAHADRLVQIISRHVDILFANADEIKALTATVNIDSAIGRAATLAPLTVLKLGKEGSLICDRANDRRYRIKARGASPEQVVDTTAAGDYYAAGFFYAMSKGASWENCGTAGAICAGEIIRVQGSCLPGFDHLKQQLQQEEILWSTK